MKRQVITILVLIIQFAGMTQESYPRLSFELNYSFQNFAMDSLNKYYVGYYTDTLKWLDHKITTGQKIEASFNYRINAYMQSGIKFGYQYGKTEKITPMEMSGFNPNTDIIDLYWNITTSATTFQVTNTLYISQFFKKRFNKKLLDNFDFGVEYNFGIGWSKFSSYYHFLNITDPQFEWMNHDLYEMRNRSLNSSLGMNLEYLFLKKNVFSSLGINLGYQFFRTGAIERNSGEEMIFEGSTPMSLDFSGWYYGIYLKLGK